MAQPPFPPCIMALPRANTPHACLHAWLLRSPDGLLMFYTVDDLLELPEHAHNDQWGVVLEGSMEFTIDGVQRTYTRGDSYFIPANVPHSVRIPAGAAGIDFFQDADRYPVTLS